MIKTNSIIIDTSSLYALLHLGLLNYLSLIYQEILVPESVERELQRKSIDLSLELAKSYGVFIKKCTSYHTDLLDVYSKELDPGESEVLAQSQYYSNTPIALIDEKKARKIADRDNIKKHGVLFILAVLDKKMKICNYNEVVEKLKTELGFRVSAEIIKKAYENAN